MVEKFILGKDFVIDTLEVDNTSFVSSIHDWNNSLYCFSQFLMNVTGDIGVVPKSVNFTAMNHFINTIAKGQNIWDRSEAGKLYSNRYLSLFAALPSTTIMVEQAVKNTKLWKQTGKGEINVTAYWIAGNGIYELRSTQKVATTYSKLMSKQKGIQIQKL